MCSQYSLPSCYNITWWFIFLPSSISPESKTTGYIYCLIRPESQDRVRSWGRHHLRQCRRNLSSFRSFHCDVRPIVLVITTDAVLSLSPSGAAHLTPSSYQPDKARCSLLHLRWRLCRVFVWFLSLSFFCSFFFSFSLSEHMHASLHLPVLNLERH